MNSRPEDAIAAAPTSHSDEMCSVCGDDNIVAVIKGSANCHYCGNQVNLCRRCFGKMMGNIKDLKPDPCENLSTWVGSLGGWIDATDRLPPDNTPVLVDVAGCDSLRILEVRWENPTYEETFEAFRYWDDPKNDGQVFEDRVLAWQPLPNKVDIPAGVSGAAVSYKNGDNREATCNE